MAVIIDLADVFAADPNYKLNDNSLKEIAELHGYYTRVEFEGKHYMVVNVGERARLLDDYREWKIKEHFKEG